MFRLFFFTNRILALRLISKKINLTHQFYVDNLNNNYNQNLILADFLELPFESNSVDAVLLPHTLDMHKSQHELLREVARILLPGGHLLMVCFNPYSYFGIKKSLHCQSMCTPWILKMLSSRRAIDWLELLEFEILSLRHLHQALPLGRYLNNKWVDFCFSYLDKKFTYLGSCYIIMAKKRVNENIMMKSKWQLKAKKVKSNNIIEV